MENFRKKFPSVIPLNDSLTEFDGFLTIMGQDFRVNVTVDTEKNVTLLGNWKLRQVLQNEDRILRKKPSLRTFLHEVEALLEQKLKKSQLMKEPLLSLAYYGTILGQIQQVGWEKVSFISEDLRDVHLSTTDGAGRCHVLQLSFPFGFPDKEVKCTTGLPVPFEVKWKKSTTLNKVYEDFTEKIPELQKFWICMDQLQQNCWILEPENPTTKDCRRRLALSGNSSIHIHVNPLEPTAIPAYDFMGPDDEVCSLMDTIQKNMEKWDKEKTLLDNLVMVLEVKFPSPETASEEHLKRNCGICYGYVLDGALPDCICDDIHCKRPFHQSCLYEWLRSLPSARQNYDVLFGLCPYCKKPISCKIA